MTLNLYILLCSRAKAQVAIVKIKVIANNHGGLLMNALGLIM